MYGRYLVSDCGEGQRAQRLTLLNGNEKFVAIPKQDFCACTGN